MPELETRKVALITGCSEPTSLGAAMARYLLGKGWRVFATARKVEVLDSLEKMGCDVLSLDVTSESSIQAVVEQITVSTGRLDLLVNNAGVAALMPVLSISPARLSAMFEINVLGVLRVTQAFADLLIRTANSARLGVGAARVVNMGSVAGYGTPWGGGGYGATKAAVHSMSNALRQELAPLGIKVITVEASAFKSAMNDRLKPFAITDDDHPTSPYFANWPTQIEPAYLATMDKHLKSAPTPEVVARKILDDALKTNPPGRMWVGSMAWVFKWVWGLLSANIADKAVAKEGALFMVERPQFD